MSLFALSLILISSLGWAGLDWARKVLTERMGPFPLLVGLTAGQALLLAPWILSGGSLVVHQGYWVPAFASVALNMAANWLFVRAIALSPFSLTIPYLALTPMFTAMIAVPLLHEVPTPGQVAGIMAVVAGALMLNPPVGHGPWGLLLGLARERGSLYMAGVALLWSLSSPLDKLATGHASPAFHGLVLSAALPVGFLAIMAAEKRLGDLRQLRHRPDIMGLAIVFGAAALVLQLTAMQLTLVSLVEAIKRVIGLVMAAIVGRMAFQEALTRRKLAALITMALGVVLILVHV